MPQAKVHPRKKREIISSSFSQAVQSVRTRSMSQQSFHRTTSQVLLEIEDAENEEKIKTLDNISIIKRLLHFKSRFEKSFLNQKGNHKSRIGELVTTCVVV